MQLLVIVIALATFALWQTLPALAAEPFVKVLTSAKGNLNVEFWQADARELTAGASSGTFSIRKMRLHGGK